MQAAFAAFGPRLYNRSVRRIPSVLIIAGVLCALAVGRAAAGPNQKAKDQLQQGHVAYNLGHFSEAAAHYEKAYRFVQDPALLFNVGQAWRLGNEPEKATAAYKGYLRTSGANSPNRKMAEEHIKDLERQMQARDKPATPPQPSAPTRQATPPPVAKDKVEPASDNNEFRPLADTEEKTPTASEQTAGQTSWIKTADPIVGAVLALGTQRGFNSKLVANYHIFGKASHAGIDYEVGYFHLPLFAPNPAFYWSAIYGKMLTRSKWMIEAGALGSHGELFGGAGKDWGLVKISARLERIGDPNLCAGGNATYVSPEILASVPVTSTLRVNAYGHLRQNIANTNCGFHPSISTLDVSGVWAATSLVVLGGGLGFYRMTGQQDGTPAGGSWPDLADNAGHFHLDGRYDFGVFKVGASFRRIIYDEGVNLLTFDVELRPGRL